MSEFEAKALKKASQHLQTQLDSVKHPKKEGFRIVLDEHKPSLLKKLFSPLFKSWFSTFTK